MPCFEFCIPQGLGCDALNGDGELGQPGCCSGECVDGRCSGRVGCRDWRGGGECREHRDCCSGSCDAPKQRCRPPRYTVCEGLTGMLPRTADGSFCDPDHASGDGRCRPDYSLVSVETTLLHKCDPAHVVTMHVGSATSAPSDAWLRPSLPSKTGRLTSLPSQPLDPAPVVDSTQAPLSQSSGGSEPAVPSNAPEVPLNPAARLFASHQLGLVAVFLAVC